MDIFHLLGVITPQDWYLESHRVSTTNGFRTSCDDEDIRRVFTTSLHIRFFSGQIRIRPYPPFNLPLAPCAVRWWIRTDTCNFTCHITHHRNNVSCVWSPSSNASHSFLRSTWKSHRFDGLGVRGVALEELWSLPATRNFWLWRSYPFYEYQPMVTPTTSAQWECTNRVPTDCIGRSDFWSTQGPTVPAFRMLPNTQYH